MTDCPPIAIANALKSEFNTGLAADTFSLNFDIRVGFGDFDEKLTADAMDTAMVDIVLPVKPTVELVGRPYYEHRVNLTVGLRQKLSGDKRNADGSMNMDEVAPLVNLFYELIGFLLPDADYRHGRKLTDVATATLAGTIDIVKLWNPDLLQTDKQYCGIFRVPFIYKEA